MEIKVRRDCLLTVTKEFIRISAGFFPAFCITLISYAGKFRIFLMVDLAILPAKEDAESLLKHISTEIQALHRLESE